jgi:hypothetical protein
MMTKITEAARTALLEQIAEQYSRLRSWRKVAECYPRRADGSQIVKAGTLNRITNEAGEWIPKDREILVALGLIAERSKEPQPEWLRRRKKAIRKMVKETKKAVLKR